VMAQLRQHPERGKMNAIVWQVAGALIYEGRDPKTLDWNGAHRVYQTTKTAGQGGKRLPIKERLQQISAAM